MAEKYLAKLERQWEQNRKTTIGSTLQMLFKRSFGSDPGRAKSLRGPDFANELIRLAALTKDERFQDALFAFFLSTISSTIISISCLGKRRTWPRCKNRLN